MSKLAKKKILITAGPTQEPLDPVRYISNHSSGKMGLAIVQECVARGAEVQLVVGPVQLATKSSQWNTTEVTTAHEMYEAVAQYFSESDVIIFAAAVADYTPSEVASTKIKKTGDTFLLALKKTKDIAQEMGKLKRANQVSVGFALETNNEESNALAKLEKKNFDMIVLNSMQDSGAGFQHDTNKITVYDKHKNVVTFELKSKDKVAIDILNQLELLL